MPLTKIIRHGFEFWEAPSCSNPPLPELETQSPLESLAGKLEYRRRHVRLKESMDAQTPVIPPKIANIQTATVEAFGIRGAEFYGRNRTGKVANARIASMALCRAFTELTVEEIAEAHNRHHRVVCHASYRFGELRRADPAFAAAVAKIESSLVGNPALN